MRHDDKERRFMEFPSPLRELGYRNVIINRIMQAYAYGEIITFQEALCRMVVELASSGDASNQALVDLMQRSSVSCFVPKQPE